MPTTGAIILGGHGAVESSRDGRTIVGDAYDPKGIERRPAIWQRAAEWRLLGFHRSRTPLPCDDLLSTSYGTSPDGSVIVGIAWNGCTTAHAFRWEETTGMVDLGSIVAGRSSRANGVSGDGRVVVGGQDTSRGHRQGARWVDGRQELFTGPAGGVGDRQHGAVNHDGSIVAGRQCRFPDLASNQSAWIWTAPGRRHSACPSRRSQLGGAISVKYAMSDDGRVIGGGQAPASNQDAVIWIDRSPAYLKDFLRANGVPTRSTTWINTGEITGVSPDGRILVGLRCRPRDFRGYMVILGFQGRDAMAAQCATASLGLLLVGRSPFRYGRSPGQVSGLAGYTPTSALDRRAPESESRSTSAAGSPGACRPRGSSRRDWGAEALWTQQSSALQPGTEAGSANLLTFTAGQLHGNVVYRFGAADASLRPFAFAGLGATSFSGDELAVGNQVLAGVGGGVKYCLGGWVGVRGHFRYKPMMLGDNEPDDFCDPFGFCQGTLHQVEFAAGAVVRF